MKKRREKERVKRGAKDRETKSRKSTKSIHSQKTGLYRSEKLGERERREGKLRDWRA